MNAFLGGLVLDTVQGLSEELVVSLYSGRAYAASGPWFELCAKALSPDSSLSAGQGSFLIRDDAGRRGPSAHPDTIDSSKDGGCALVWYYTNFRPSNTAVDEMADGALLSKHQVEFYHLIKAFHKSAASDVSVCWTGPGSTDSTGVDDRVT